MEDNSGTIWFGTRGNGLYCFNGKTFSNFDIEEGLRGNYVYQIIKDKKGHLWIGTNKGVSCYNGKSFNNYTSINGLADNSVLSIIEDRKGIIWLGTSNGVSQFDGKSFTSISFQQGLTNKFIWDIEDQTGNIWFSLSKWFILL
ncbi:MAG: hypothetical protein IPI23_16030 [Bacteroidetes bacterium]|nr:hypothetical protein [Bacteroidota bacterium]